MDRDQDLQFIDREQGLLAFDAYDDAYKDDVQVCQEKQSRCTCSYTSKRAVCRCGAFSDLSALFY